LKEEILNTLADQKQKDAFVVRATSHRILGRCSRATWLGSLLLVSLAAMTEDSLLQAQTKAVLEKAEDSAQIKAPGVVLGSVKDPQEAAVVGAQVRLTDSATNQTSTVLTDERGMYRFAALPASTYNLEVSAKSFKTAMIRSLKVTAYNIVYQDVSLALGETSEVVQVTATVTDRDYDALQAPSPVAIPESAKMSTETFYREEIRAINPANVFETASLAAGIKTEFQGRRAFNFLETRGGDSMGIIIDGYYMPMTQYSRVLALLPPDAIESIKIIRGSTSLSLGPLMSLASPLGSPNQGFMVITTRKGNKRVGSAVADIGNLGSYKGGLYYGDRIGRFSYFLAGAGNDYQGPDGWYAQNNSESFLLRMQYGGSSFSVDFTAYGMTGMREMQRSLPYSSAYNQKWKYDPLHSVMISFTLGKSWSDKQTTSFAYSHGLITDHMVLETFTNPAKTIQTERDEADNFHLWHTAALGSDTLKIGFQTVMWDNPTGVLSWAGTPRKETMIGGYIQEEHRFGQRFSVDAAIRVDDKYIVKGSDKYSPAIATNKRIADEWTSPVVALSAGANYRLNSIYQLSAGFGYSHQETDPFLATLNSKNLAPEARYRYEIGAQANFHPAFNPKLTLFYYDINNFKISAGTVGTGVNAVTVYNATDVIRKGLEFSVGGKIPYLFGYSFNYSRIGSTRRADDIGLPHDLFSLVVNRSIGPFDANLTAKRVDPFYSNVLTNNVYIKVGDYTQLNANLGYNFKSYGHAARVTAYVRNLLDDHYDTSGRGYPDVGRVYGIRLEFGLSPDSSIR
jgi:iron complex outermembrane receptor protein